MQRKGGEEQWTHSFSGGDLPWFIPKECIAEQEMNREHECLVLFAFYAFSHYVKVAVH